MLANVSHKAWSTTAVKIAPRTRQFRVGVPRPEPLPPQDGAHQPRPRKVPGRRGQPAHQEHLVQHPEIALGGEQGDECVSHRLQTREARRGGYAKDNPRRLRAITPKGK
jgi:hypothetical protein